MLYFMHMEHVKSIFKALAMVGLLVIGVMSILVVLEVISLNDMREPMMKTIMVLGIVGLMTAGVYVLQRRS